MRTEPLKISKAGHVNPFARIFVTTAPLVMYLHAKFDVSSSTVPEIWSGSKNFKSRSPLSNPFNLILHFFRYYPWQCMCMPLLTFLAATVPEI